MTVPAVGVLALQGDVREHVLALGEAGADARPVRRLSEIESVDGLVIPGGESTTLWKLAAAFELLDPLRKLIADGLPAFGSCAGLIMLADRLVGGAPGQQTLGGIDMTARRNAFGRQVDSFEREVRLRLDPGSEAAAPASDAAVPASGAPFHAVFIRAPWVERAGAQVAVLGEDDGRIVAVRQGPLLATAFHPELTSDRRIHELFVKMVKGTS
ncbi:MAG TPA: pyridoxal 5'-phosphate synthase glutaminase subunit PdxT [Trebonia sp.]